ncbi:MAG: T9SS type A sorting domain-containing protein [Calditrichia bacterium]
MNNYRYKAGIIVAVFLMLTFFITDTFAQSFQLGDVFAAVSNGNVNRYASDGTFIETLNIGTTGFTTGMAFDSSGNLYVTGFTANIVAVFDNDGNLVGTFGSGYSTPESIVFDNTGNVYVGNLGNGIRKYDAAGTYLGSVITSRVDWMDLAADQTTMLYTVEGANIQTVDVSTGTPGPNFTTGTATNAFALRILSDGSVLLADMNNIKHYDASGTVIQTYDAPGENSWFALNLDPDGTSFWSGGFGTSNFYKFDIATGAVLLGPINTGTGSSTLYGLAVYGEITAAVNNPPICQITPPGPFNINVNDPLSFTIDVSDPDNGDTLTLSASGLPAGATMNPALPLMGPNTGFSSTFDWIAQAGNYSVQFVVSDGEKQSTCVVEIAVNGGGGDNTAPTCELTAMNPGPPLSIEVTVQDGQSGLASINVVKAKNAVVSSPVFSVGTTGPVVVTATKIDNSQGASVVLETIDVAGNSTTCDPVYTTISAITPEEFNLAQNYPNPFNPTTSIHFNIPEAQNGSTPVSLTIYDLSGRLVTELISEPMQPGQYSVVWDATNFKGNPVSGGVYIYRLQAGEFTATRKMILMK